MAGRLACLLCLSACVLAAQAQDVVVNSWFPDNPAGEFFPGQDVTCVIGVRNGAATPINVTFATANLASPFNAQNNLFNFTVGVLDSQTVQPGEERSLEYQLFFPKQIPPHEFILQMSLYYTVDNALVAPRMFLNQTINVNEAPTLVDTQLLGLIAMGAASIAGLAYVVKEWLTSKGYIRRAKKTRVVATRAAGPGDKTEWLRGTAWDQAQRKKQG